MRSIDACDMIDSIVQCKLRKNKLSLSECATFFASQNIFCSKENKTIIKWNNLIIARNKESKLSSNLSNKFKLNMFIDIQFSIDDIISYCENLLINPPIYPIMDTTFLLRDYQYEAIDNINNNNNKNVIISLPTGCGKNIIIIYSLNINNKYLILVPRIILMEQFKYEIIKHKPEYKHNINCIGDHNTCYKDNKKITICVYNSIHILLPFIDTFDKIFIDEAHHILHPDIYNDNDINIETSDNNDENEKYTTIIKNLSKYNNNSTAEKLPLFKINYFSNLI